MHPGQAEGQRQQYTEEADSKDTAVFWRPWEYSVMMQVTQDAGKSYEAEVEQWWAFSSNWGCQINWQASSWVSVGGRTVSLVLQNQSQAPARPGEHSDTLDYTLTSFSPDCEREKRTRSRKLTLLQTTSSCSFPLTKPSFRERNKKIYSVLTGACMCSRMRLLTWRTLCFDKRSRRKGQVTLYSHLSPQYYAILSCSQHSNRRRQ